MNCLLGEKTPGWGLWKMTKVGGQKEENLARVFGTLEWRPAPTPYVFQSALVLSIKKVQWGSGPNEEGFLLFQESPRVSRVQLTCGLQGWVGREMGLDCQQILTPIALNRICKELFRVSWSCLACTWLPCFSSSFFLNHNFLSETFPPFKSCYRPGVCHG